MLQRGSLSVGCLGVLLVTGMLGCDSANPAKGPDRKVVTLPGMAPVGMDPMDGGRAAPAQQPGAQPNPQQAMPMPQPGQPMPMPQFQPMPQPVPQPQQPVDDGKGIIGKSTNQVAEMRQAMAQNPALIIVSNKAAGDDPLTFAASAYVSARSRASMFGFEAALKQHKIVEERPPTYAEFTDMMKQNRIEFTALYRWQMYAYDPVEGRIVILEDPALKPKN